MRALLTLLLVTSALATPVHAQWAGDRYGYGPAPKSAAAPPPPVAFGRVLDWSNKSVTPADPIVDDRQDTRYVAPDLQRPIDHPPQRMAALSPSPSMMPRPMARQSVSASSTPLAPVELAGGPPEPAQYARPEQPIRQAAATATSGQARYYSLHREYGLSPDAIPEQPTGARYVLIGPSTLNGLGRESTEEHDSTEGAGDKPF